LGEKKRQLAGNVHSAMAIDPSVHVSLVCSDTFVVFRSRKSTKQKQNKKKEFRPRPRFFFSFFEDSRVRSVIGDIERERERAPVSQSKKFC
jgi:hypothetical protein